MELDGIDKFDNKLKVIDESLAELISERDKLASTRTMPVAKGLDPELEGINKSIELLETQRKALIKSQSAWVRFSTAVKGAIASIGATLGIMAAVTAVIALVNAISNYIKKLNEAANAQQKLNKEINELTNKTASKAIVVLKELAIAYGKVGDTAEEKQKFLTRYADKIKETGLAIDTVVEAEDAFVNNTQKYVAAIMARAKAQATEQKAIEIYQKYLDDRYDLEQKIEKANSDLQNVKPDYGKPMGAGVNAAYEEELIRKTIESTQNAMDELDKDIEERLRKMFEDVADLEKEYSGVFASLVTTTTTGPDGTN